MLIRNPDDIAPKTMTMPGAEGVEMRLMVGRADGAPNFAMRIFDVEPGGQTPHHQHNYEHEILVLDGEGEAYSGDTPHPVKQGDVLFVPANEVHQFRNTSDKPFRFMCMVPTAFDCGEEGCKPTPGS
ncbi:MAG: cupin domain-containing protein [Phycisphaerales bacterium JB063]